MNRAATPCWIGAVLGRVVGRVGVPAGPDDPEPGAPKDPDRLGVALAAGAGVGVELARPWGAWRAWSAKLNAAPKIILNDQELRRMLAKRAKTLHLGVANYCWFTDPSKALCLRLAGTPTADRPLIGMCDSARCPQATHHPCHRPAWEQAVTSTTVFLGNLGRGQKTERTRLETQLDRAQRVLAALDAASGPAGSNAETT
jgi:hypothetical protein